MNLKANPHLVLLRTATERELLNVARNKAELQGYLGDLEKTTKAVDEYMRDVLSKTANIEYEVTVESVKTDSSQSWKITVRWTSDMHEPGASDTVIVTWNPPALSLLISNQ